MPAATYSITIYKRARSPFWWARWYTGGKDDQRWSTGVRISDRESRRLAADKAKEQAAERAKQRPVDTGPESWESLKEVTKRMILQKEAHGRRERAVETLGWQISKHVLPFFGETRDVRSIKRADLEAFKAHLRSNFKAQTINNMLTAVRQILKHAFEVDELMESIPEVSNVPSDKDPKYRILTPAELDLLIKSVDPRAVEAKDYLVFVANTGLRKSEAMAVRFSWVDWEARTLSIPSVYVKGGRTRPVVHLNDAAIELLERRRANPPKRQKDRDRVFLDQKHDAARNSAAETAGLGRVRTHDLRHTRGSLAHASGASLPEVRDMLGHTTLAMVNHYAHSYDDRLRDLANSLNLGVGSVPTSVTNGKNRSGRKGKKSAHKKSKARR